MPRTAPPGRPARLPALARAGRRAPQRQRVPPLVPALSPALRGGIEVPGDHQVDNRALLAALVDGLPRAGVAFVEGTRRRGSVPGPSSSWRTAAASPRTTSSWRPGPACPASAVSRPPGFPRCAPSRATSSARPAPAGSPRRSPARPHGARPRPRPLGLSRAAARRLGRGGRDGRGAGRRHRGAGGRGARAALRRTRHRPRPSTSSSCSRRPPASDRPPPDNTPRIGWTDADGVAVATGHYRSGIVLAPLTAAAVSDLLAQRRGSPSLSAGVTAWTSRRHAASLSRVNGEPLEIAGGQHHRRPRRPASRSAPTRRALPSPWTAASCRARSGPRRRPGPAALRRGRRGCRGRLRRTPRGPCRCFVVPRPRCQNLPMPEPSRPVPPRSSSPAEGRRARSRSARCSTWSASRASSPDIVTATSAGAIVATVLAQARTLRRVHASGSTRSRTTCWP